MSPREIPSCQIQRANFDRKKEEPYATILGCSDSRAPPESIFDANFGELFILGRWQCHFGRRHGQHAIRWSALEYNALCGFWGTRGGAVRPALHTFGDNVLPGLPEFAPSVSGQDQLALAVQAAVRWSMHQLLETPERNRAVQEGRAKLVGAVFQINPGQVRFLS